MSASSRLPPALRLRQILTRVPGRILRRLKRGLTRSDPRLETYLAALDSPVDPGLVLWQGHGAGLVQDWATRPQEGGQTHVLALERPGLLPAPPGTPTLRPGSADHARAMARAGMIRTDQPLPLWALRRADQQLICRGADDSPAWAHGLRQMDPGPAPRPQIALFGGGWKNNGITTSLLNLLGGLADHDLDLHLVTEARSPEALANLARLDPRIRVIHRETFPMRATEAATLRRFQTDNDLSDPVLETQIRALFTREARRLFGGRIFDAALDFSGYSREWAALIAATPARRHVIWQHNHLQAEAERRFDSLKGVFAAYRWFDTIASVSDETREVNRTHLARHYPPGARILTLRNVIDPAALRRRAAGALPPGLDLTGAGPLFVMSGRLSPEKAQMRALTALAQLRRQGQEARLILLGSGPLEGALRAGIARLGLGGQVTLAGHVENPFPVLARADCFVLSSDYEGQPMVLLEALTLGLPIIATDIPGARSVLAGLEGPALVPADAAGLAQGMARFLAGGVAPARFDAEAYRAETLSAVLTELLGQVPPRRPT